MMQGMQRFSNPAPGGRGGFRPFMPRDKGYGYNPGARQQQMMNAQSVTYDGKRMRKAVYRKTVDYNSSAVNYLENRIWQRDHRDQRGMGTDPLYSVSMVPPPCLKSKPMNCVTTKFIRTSTNKIRCPIFCVCWTPEGRRLITGASSGEFTLWNGLTFNFETILQAHDSSVRSMVWSHNDLWMLTADHAGFIKYWQSNMNNVKMYQAHKDPVRGLSYCPTDQKFASCSDDGTVRIWDFQRCTEERILRGHGADVKCVDWHPQKSLVVSGSKDTQQPVKLWDARMGNSLATIHAHKHTVMEVKWNKNGNWLLTASRDHLLKLFDIRKMKEELQTFKGHKKEATTVAWHPVHENLFTSGGSDGAIMFWLVGHDKEVGSMDEAHETMVWSLAWHPLGHILSSGSNDHTTKFWTRNRVGDRMRDKYNLNTLPLGTSEDMLEYDNDYSQPSIPGMGLEFGLPEHLQTTLVPSISSSYVDSSGGIPGLGMDPGDALDKPVLKKKVPYAKPIPKNFEKAWESGAQPSMIKGEGEAGGGQGAAEQKTGPPPPGPPNPAGAFSQPPPGAPPTHLPPPVSGPPGYGGPPGGGGGYYGGNAPPQGPGGEMGNNRWGKPSSQNEYGDAYRYQNPDGNVNGRYGAQGYSQQMPHPGRGRGRGNPRMQGPPNVEGGPPSLLDLPMQKRSWEAGPGEGGGGAGGGGEAWGDNDVPDENPAKYGRMDSDNGPGGYRGSPRGRPPMRGRGGPPMRGGPHMRGAPYRGRGGPPPMRSRGGGRGGRGMGW